MKTIKGYSLLSVILLMTSCWTAKFPTHGDKIALSNNNYQLINGTYKNVDTTKEYGRCLWPLLDKERRYNNSLPDVYDTCKRCVVTIKTITNNKLIASLISPQQQALKTIKLKYRTRRGCIKTKTQYHAQSQYVILWAFFSHTSQLTLTKEQNLIVDNHPCVFAYAVFMMDWGNKENDHNIFNKINTP